MFMVMPNMTLISAYEKYYFVILGILEKKNASLP